MYLDKPVLALFLAEVATAPGTRDRPVVADIANDADLTSALDLFEVFTLLAAKCPEQAEAYVFTRWDIVEEWIALMRSLRDETGFKYKRLLVWDKGIPGMGDIDSDWGCGHELILYLKRGLREVPYRHSGIIHVDTLGRSSTSTRPRSRSS